MNNSRFTIVNADILLSTDTVEAESTVIDVKNNIQELSFYESINKEYIDARIVLLDDFGFRNELNTTGTERIYLAIADATDPTLPIIEKTFFFSKINYSICNFFFRFDVNCFWQKFKQNIRI